MLRYDPFNRNDTRNAYGLKKTAGYTIHNKVNATTTRKSRQ